MPPEAVLATAIATKCGCKNTTRYSVNNFREREKKKCKSSANHLELNAITKMSRHPASQSPPFRDKTEQRITRILHAPLPYNNRQVQTDRHTRTSVATSYFISRRFCTISDCPPKIHQINQTAKLMINAPTPQPTAYSNAGYNSYTICANFHDNFVQMSAGITKQYIGIKTKLILGRPTYLIWLDRYKRTHIHAPCRLNVFIFE